MCAVEPVKMNVEYGLRCKHVFNVQFMACEGVSSNALQYAAISRACVKFAYSRMCNSHKKC